MQYDTTVEIALPIDAVIALYEDRARDADWQETLVSLEFISGEPGQVGTTTRLHHKMGKRESTMVETITERSLPDLFTATYEAKGVYNLARNRFAAIEDGRTRWTLETEFRCSGSMWVLTTVAPGMFRKQTRATMEAFKAFAESRPS